MSDASAKPIYEYTPDGWLVGSCDQFHYLTHFEPPRPSRFWRQVRIDMKGRPPQILCGIGITLIALAIFKKWWVLLAPAFILFNFYIRVFTHHLRQLRDQVIYQGVLGDPRPHPIYPLCAVADATTPTGEVIPVAFDRKLVEPILAEGQVVEVIFNHGPEAEFGGVIGARAKAR